jgi:hypothetical protein
MLTDERKVELLNWIEQNITDRFPDSVMNLDIGRIRVRIMRLCHEMLGLTDAFPVKDYDPITKEKDLYTMEEFAATARAEITSWHHLFEKNHADEKLTWSEWMNNFIGYMSW